MKLDEIQTRYKDISKGIQERRIIIVRNAITISTRSFVENRKAL